MSDPQAKEAAAVARSFHPLIFQSANIGQIFTPRQRPLARRGPDDAYDKVSWQVSVQIVLVFLSLSSRPFLHPAFLRSPRARLPFPFRRLPMSPKQRVSSLRQLRIR